MVLYVYSRKRGEAGTCFFLPLRLRRYGCEFTVLTLAFFSLFPFVGPFKICCSVLYYFDLFGYNTG